MSLLIRRLFVSELKADMYGRFTMATVHRLALSLVNSCLSQQE